MIIESPVSNYLDENDLGVFADYGWSGYALMHLMFLLEKTGTPLGAAEYRAETEVVNAVYDLTYLITSADKRYLSTLDRPRLDREAAELFADDYEEVRQALDDGLDLLCELIAELDDNEVLVVHIG